MRLCAAGSKSESGTRQGSSDSAPPACSATADAASRLPSGCRSYLEFVGPAPRTLVGDQFCFPCGRKVTSNADLFIRLAPVALVVAIPQRNDRAVFVPCGIHNTCEC